MTWLPGAPSRLRLPSWAAASRGWPRRTGWPSSTAWTSSCWRPTAASGARSRPRPWPGCRSTPGRTRSSAAGPTWPSSSRGWAWPTRSCGRGRVARSSGRAGRLRRIPQGGAFGIPDRVLPLLRSRLLSPARRRSGRVSTSCCRAPRCPPTPPWRRSLRPRLGDEVVERIVQPLLGGVHAGSASTGSARAAPCPTSSGWPGPAGRSCSRCAAGAASARNHAADPAPPLVSLRGGLSGWWMRPSSPRSVPTGVRAGAPVTALRRVAGGWRLTTPGVGRRAAGGAGGAGARERRAAGGLDPGLAHELRGIEYVDVATVTLALPRAEVGELVGTGFLVPPVEGALLVGCTWLTSKWPHLADAATDTVSCGAWSVATVTTGGPRWMTPRWSPRCAPT